MAARRKPLTLPETVAKGDFRVSLEALRDVLAARIEAAEPRETAALARQLADVLVKLAGLPVKEKSKVDDLAKRRSRRRAQVSERAGGQVVGGQGGG